MDDNKKKDDTSKDNCKCDNNETCAHENECKCDCEHKKNSEKMEKIIEVNIDYKEQAARALADYRNLQRKTEEERRAMYTIAKSQVLSEFIPTLDMLNTAEVFIKDPGLKMVIDGFKKTLTDLGLIEVELLGKPFDPHTAEAVATVYGEENDMVTKVIKSSYKLQDTIVRIGQVEVSKKK